MVRMSAVPSTKNPSLVVFVVDNSPSMIDSGQHSHIMETLKEMKSIANGKPKIIKFALISFDSRAYLEYSGFMEHTPLQFNLTESIDRQTNLKAAAREVKRIVQEHTSNCVDNNPTISVLFFTDGGHTAPLEPGTSIDQYLDFQPNVTCGLINYSLTAQDNFPKRMAPLDYRLSKVTRLTEQFLKKAYAREGDNPVTPESSLLNVFGDWKDLVGKLFIIGSETVKSNPGVTAAFVKLGSFSSIASDFEGTNIDVAGEGLNLKDEFAGLK